jgi:GT2 family glycosyltransferase
VLPEVNQQIRVAVVAPVHNRKELTLVCLRSLSRADIDGIDLQIVIVDDGSTDGTSEAIGAGFPHVEIVRAHGDLWFTEGTNVGIRKALESDPKYILMMNDDQVFDMDFLKYLVETAETNPRSVVGPLLLLWDQPHKLLQVAPVWNTWRGGWQHWYQQTVWTVPKRPWEVDIIVGNCVLVPASAIKECGLMNSTRYPNFGDAEYTPRLKRAGWKLLIDPRSRVFCQPNNIPPRVRSKGFRSLVYDLFIDLKNVHSLRRRWYAYIDGGPSKLKGTIAFMSFVVRAALGRSPESIAFSKNRSEPPLKDTFSSAQSV